MRKKVLRRAIEIARNEYTRHTSTYKHWSFIVQEGEIIEWARNNRLDTPLGFLGYKDFQFLHAEPQAMKRAWGLLNHRVPFGILNVRLIADLSLAMSKPCKVCMPFVLACGANEVVWSTNEGTFEGLS